MTITTIATFIDTITTCTTTTITTTITIIISTTITIIISTTITIIINTTTTIIISHSINNYVDLRGFYISISYITTYYIISSAGLAQHLQSETSVIELTQGRRRLNLDLGSGSFLQSHVASATITRSFLLRLSDKGHA